MSISKTVPSGKIEHVFEKVFFNNSFLEKNEHSTSFLPLKKTTGCAFGAAAHRFFYVIVFLANVSIEMGNCCC